MKRTNSCKWFLQSSPQTEEKIQLMPTHLYTNGKICQPILPDKRKTIFRKKVFCKWAENWRLEWFRCKKCADSTSSLSLCAPFKVPCQARRHYCCRDKKCCPRLALYLLQLETILFKNRPIPASFCLFSSFSHCNFNNTNWKSVDSAHGIWTRGRMMVGADDTTELLQPP